MIIQNKHNQHFAVCIHEQKKLTCDQWQFIEPFYLNGQKYVCRNDYEKNVNSITKKTLWQKYLIYESIFNTPLFMMAARRMLDEEIFLNSNICVYIAE